MRYLSTRGGMPPRRFCEILLEGLAPDGGLVVPETYPHLTLEELARWRDLSYPALALEVLRRYVDDLPEAQLRDIVARTYTREVFGSADITPVRTLAPGLHILQLSNGPTLAFKDLAMQFLGNLFEHVLSRSGQRLNILGATSGDTGSAAEYAMRGKHGIRVFMLSPYGRMSPFQTAQMYALQDENIFNIGIRGVFDECQDLVKAVSSDAQFKARHRIGAVNSINWARVIAQVVYYFKAYFAVAHRVGDPVSFAVPSGNFGNIFAGHIARRMGLPIHRLILATNENDVLDEFFRSGRYRVRKGEEVHQTSSPSMDISKASNFERFIYDLSGGDAAQVLRLWQQVERGGGFDLRGTDLMPRLADCGFVSGSSSHADRMDTIRRVYRDYGVMIDTHTADGLKVGLEHRDADVALICLETALPAKFADAVREALGRDPEVPASLRDIEQLPQRVEVMDADVQAVKAFIAAGCED
ncbi:MAG: threonine synthase [Burkholderiales bacterium]|nr:threonine synthase [Burkholderiales bacterium]